MPALGKTRSWQSFEGWCHERGLSPAPAHPWTLAVYIRVIEGTMRYDALKRHVDQIGQAHFEMRRTRPDREPSVQRVLDAVRRREEAKKRRKQKPPPPPPLFRAEDFPEEKTSKKPRTRQDKTAKAARGKTADAANKKKSKSLRVTPKLVRRKRV